MKKCDWNSTDHNDCDYEKAFRICKMIMIVTDLSHITIGAKKKFLWFYRSCSFKTFSKFLHSNDGDDYKSLWNDDNCDYEAHFNWLRWNKFVAFIFFWQIKLHWIW